MFERSLVTLCVAAVVFGACTGGPAGRELVTEETMARDLGAPVMEHIRRGHVPERSAEVYLVPRPHRFLLGPHELTALWSERPVLGSSHPNPWDYLTRVPIILAGPHIPRGRDVDEVADIAQIAPTYARILGMDDFEAGAPPLPQLDVEADPPKVIFSVVIDGGGWNVLQEYPDSWPHIAKLRERGITYTNATIGSAPSITGALHATFGTGFYPIDHGIPGNQMRDTEGRNVDAYLDDADPRFLLKPAVSELWDERNGNRALVGTVSYEGWHLGMIGHGAQRDGGDRDIAVLWSVEDNEWWINEDYYELPSYLQTTDLERLERYERQLDPRDGLRDGDWFDHDLAELQEDIVRPGTPAFARFTGDAVLDIMSRERLGDDDITDLFWVEMKMPDFAGHLWNMVNPEQGDVLRETDRQIGRFVKELDRAVGRDNYVFMVSADHGQQPLPELKGGWRVNNRELQTDLEAEFGDVIEKVTPVDIYVEREALDDEGLLEDMAEFLGSYTVGDNVPDDARGRDRVPDALLDNRIFAGAFSTTFLQGLTPERVEGFGRGIYAEGDFDVRGIDPAG